MEKSPARGFAADAGRFAGLQQSVADLIHPNIAKEFHRSASALAAERVLERAGVDARGLANISERKRQVGVGAHELFGGIELVAAGFLLAVGEARVIMRMRAQE